jgi:hypothetical protein
LDACDGFLRFENDSLLGSEIVNEIATEYRHGAVREANRNLGKVIEGGESRDLAVSVGSNVCFIGMHAYRELSFRITNVDSAQTGGHIGLLNKLVQRPGLENGFRAHVLL